MSNHTQANPSSTRPSVGTRIRGVFETAHGIGDNIRGRTLGAIDHLTCTGSPDSKSHHSSIADRGRMETERGMARIYGYPDPNAVDHPQNAPVRFPQPDSGALGSGHATGTGSGAGYMREDDYGHDGGMYGGVGKGAGGYGTNDGYGQTRIQNFDHQQPTIDENTRVGPDSGGKGGLSPMRAPQDTGSETGQPSMPQAENYPPTQKRIRDISPDPPPQPQPQAADNDQHARMYQ